MLSSLLSRKVASTVLLMLFLVGCVNVRSPEVELTMQVEPSKRPGEYTVSGTTNLPDRTEISVQGVRYFNVPLQSSPAGESSNYVILSRQVAEVAEGKWKATLNLWQVAPDGQYQEAWQLNQPQMGVAAQPSSDVTFLALTDPGNQSEKLEQQLESQGKRLEGENIRFTADGEWYVQAEQTLPVNLPTGKTTPVVGSSSLTEISRVPSTSMKSDSNSSSVQIPADFKRTTAPLTSEERFQ